MGDFGDLLNQWEKEKSKAGHQKRREEEARKSQWHQALEAYAPALPKPGDVEDSGPLTSTLAQRRRHPTQDELDLHGMTLEVALVQVKTFLESRRRRGLKKVRIIHGRGLHSGSEGVLKVQVRQWLVRQKGLKWEVCPPAEGGSGAVWVWLGD